jgi:hypothetical protein
MRPADNSAHGPPARPQGIGKAEDEPSRERTGPDVTDDGRAKQARYDVVKIAGRKFIVRKEKPGKRKAGFLHLLVNNNRLVTRQGFAKSRAPFEAYAKKIDFDALADVN